MIDIDILKNPVMIGAVIAALTYCYLYWKEQQKRKKNPKVSNRSVNVITPAVVGVIAWFIASSCFDDSSSNSNTITPNTAPTPLPTIGSTATGGNISQVFPAFPSQVANGNQNVSGESFHVIKKNSIRLPPTDVFIDLADF